MVLSRTKVPLRLIRWLLPEITKLHRAIYRGSGGRIGHRASGFRFLLLEHVGRKSGEPRTTPVLYVEDRGRFVLAASNAGQDRAPAWWLNLQARPEARVWIARNRVRVVARQAGDGEAEELWSILGASWPWFDDYRAGTDRVIPVVVLDPVE